MRSLSVLFRSLLLFAAVAGICHFGWGQEVTASIVGTVADPSGAALPGATVTATSQERGQTYKALTNDSGLYRIAQLPVGAYVVKVEKGGFALASYPAFVLTLNQVARVDVTMKVGQTTETVEVTGSAPLLATETTQVDTVINSATNDNLPLASRNYVQLTLLAPGAVTTDPSSFNSGNNTGSYGSRPLINGNREQANNFMLDGMDNNQVSDNLLGYTPAPDAIQEFNLITSNAPAEYGNFEGGIVNATIKSGTNKFHGDVWEFFRNNVLNANSWSNNLNVDPNTGLWAPLPGLHCAGMSLAAQGVGRFLRIDFSSLPTFRNSDLIPQVRQVPTRFSPLLSEAGTSVISARKMAERSTRTVSARTPHQPTPECSSITPAPPLTPRVLRHQRLLRRARPFRST